MNPIKSAVIDNVPFIGPTIQTDGLALDVKEIIDSSTPIGAAKQIGKRALKACTPPLLYYGGTCVFAVGGLIASISSGGNPLVVTATLGAVRSVVRDL